MVNDRIERTVVEKEFSPLPSPTSALLAAVAITLATFVLMMVIIYTNGEVDDTAPTEPSTTTLAPAPDTGTSPVTVTVTTTAPQPNAGNGDHK